jgi:hypothetical protein
VPGHPRGGMTKLDRSSTTSVIQVMEKILHPIVESQAMYLPDDTSFTKADLVNYNVLRMAIGMLRPSAVDHIWSSREMHYQPIVARLLTRREFYRIQRETHTNVVYLVEWCSEVLPKTW